MTKLIVISGSSGAGKSSALRLLEDEGFYCVDNLPPRLIKRFVDEVVDHRGYDNFRGVALCIDARAAKAAEDYNHALDGLLDVSGRLIIFLDAQPYVLLKRFSETRRRHPLAGADNSLPEAIARERQLLEPIADEADLIIDTSDLSTRALRDIITGRVMDKRSGLSILIQSFAFKRGVPADADFVFDARSLPNPYWNLELRDMCGVDLEVKAFLESNSRSKTMLNRIQQFLKDSLPEFNDSDRSYLTVAIGCTGGQHRSVYIADRVYEALRLDYPDIQIRHRELREIQPR